jgi:hypothetical protein
MRETLQTAGDIITDWNTGRLMLFATVFVIAGMLTIFCATRSDKHSVNDPPRGRAWKAAAVVTGAVCVLYAIVFVSVFPPTHLLFHGVGAFYASPEFEQTTKIFLTAGIVGGTVIWALLYSNKHRRQELEHIEDE